MSYSFRVHVIKNSTSNAGHAFIELNSPTGTRYFELNTNPEFVGPSWWKLGKFSDPNGAVDSDGIIASTANINQFLGLSVSHTVSPYVAVSDLQHFQMESFADIRIAAGPGGPDFAYTDYALLSNSCITFIDSMLRFANVQTPLASLFTSQDIAFTGDTSIWYSKQLMAVPRPWSGEPTPLDLVNKFAADIGFMAPPNSSPVMSMAKHQIEQLLGHSYNNTRSELEQIQNAVFAGAIEAKINYVTNGSGGEFTAPFDAASPSKMVLSGSWDAPTISDVQDGFLQHITSFPVNGTRIDTAFRPDGGRLETKTDISDNHEWSSQNVSLSPSGAVLGAVEVGDNGAVNSAQYFGATLTGEIGSALGSSLGKLLGGNSLVGQVAAGTVIGTIGKEIGNALYYGGTYTLDVAVKDAFGTLGGGSGVGALPSAAIGAISSLLIGELAKALHLDGFEGGVFTTVGTSITTQLITNAYGVATGATWGNGNAYTMYTGFDPASIATNLGTVVAAKLASTLVSQVVVPYYPEGAIGQQIGASIGGSIGATLGAVALVGIPVVGPVMGAYIGSFLGSIAGSILGDLAGNDPESRGRVVFLPDGRFYPDPSSFWGDHGASGDTFMHIATHTALTLNALADFAGVTMSAFPVDANPISNALGLQLIYTQDNHYWMINEPFQGPLSTVAYPQGVDELSPLINTGITTLAHRVTVAGGDPLVRLAWQNSHANSASAFALDRMRPERRHRRRQANNMHRGGAENRRSRQASTNARRTSLRPGSGAVMKTRDNVTWRNFTAMTCG